MEDATKIEVTPTQEGDELLHHYEVLGEVGRGGCAVVYEGRQISTGRKVALKVLSILASLPPSEMQTLIKRFSREARLIQRLDSPHIVDCLDFGSYEGRPCMVLEFVEGQGLDELIREYGALEPRLAVDIILQVLDALRTSHEEGVIHRDIKPSNIMVLGDAPNFHVKVLDFGIASMLEGMEDGNTLLTQVGSIRGTPSYMAPELFSGAQKVTPSSDVYAVGLMLLECFTSKVAFDGDSLLAIAYDQVNKKLDIPHEVPPLIGLVIEKMCAKKPELRYPTSYAAAVALKDAFENINNRSMNTIVVLRKIVTSRRLWIVGSLVLVLLILGVAAYSVLNGGRAERRALAQEIPVSEATSVVEAVTALADEETQEACEGNDCVSEVVLKQIEQLVKSSCLGTAEGAAAGVVEVPAWEETQKSAESEKASKIAAPKKESKRSTRGSKNKKKDPAFRLPENM
ncbi:MAG: serine/threonine-protein kinase [Bradymonadales bacterium]